MGGGERGGLNALLECRDLSKWVVGWERRELTIAASKSNSALTTGLVARATALAILSGRSSWEVVAKAFRPLIGAPMPPNLKSSSPIRPLYRWVGGWLRRESKEKHGGWVGRRRLPFVDEGVGVVLETKGLLENAQAFHDAKEVVVAPEEDVQAYRRWERWVGGWVDESIDESYR